MSLELAFARDFVGWRNDHPRGAIFIARMRLARSPCVDGAGWPAKIEGAGFSFFS